VPHARAKRHFARVRSHSTSKDGKPVAFAGYKAGMTHIAVLDTRKNSPTKGIEVSQPVTIIECPPMKVVGVRSYRKDAYGLHAISDHFFKADKHLARRVRTKEHSFPETLSADFSTLLVHTQPHLTGTGQKKPELFEIPVGQGKPEETLAFAKQHKELKAADVFKVGSFVDAHSLTKGQGFAGVVKKSGVGVRRHKSEKVKRGAVMGPEGYAKVTFEANMPGKWGNHTRTEWNKKIMLIDNKPITPKGGFVRYGVVKNEYILLHGSVPGTKYGLIRLVSGIRKNPKKVEDAPVIEYTSVESQQ
jgi:large subunit ribosomal protein L3